MKKSVLILLFFLTLTSIASAQSFALKSNALYLATATPNLGMEVAFSKRITLNVSGGYNNWEFNNKQSLEHWAVQPELRLWLSEKYSGHFFGVHGMYTEYDTRYITKPIELMKNRRYDGNAYGGGLTYGYNFNLSKHWNLELSIGAGYLYLEYDKFAKDDRGEEQHLGLFKNDYFGLTKASVSFVYVFR